VLTQQEDPESRSIVCLARSGRGIAGGVHRVLEAAQDEASLAALCVRPQKRRDFCLQGEGARFGGIFQKLTTWATPTLRWP
jgi:hypothetical protein